MFLSLRIPVPSLPRQTACAVLALFAYVRFQVGILWLRRFIRKKRGNDPEAIFREAWLKLTRLDLLFRGVAMFRNRFSYDWKDIVFLRLLEEMKRQDITYHPKLQLANAECLQSLPSQPKIVVTVHSPVDAILNRVFEEYGISWTLLAAGEGAACKAKLLGLGSSLDLVTRSNDTLLLLRRKLREGRLVCANIDDAQRRPKSLFCDIFVSPAMFQLAISAKANVLYAYAKVNVDGVIEVKFGNPSIDVENCTAHGYASDFVAWLGMSQNDLRARHIRDWTPTKKDKLRKLGLSETTCFRSRAELKRLQNQ